ncbi:FadR/GntR family transcriptional regulator [Mycolicibacterium sp.]|uniref:FadR/GntR family transcriptional regulator n=1 Tax=Mycolicibacterium sp. TaxID=2320850 RepID=UPI0037CC4D30
MNLAKSHVRSRAQVVAAQIEDEIARSSFDAGHSLGRRRELIERYRISPTVLNEVLRILRDSGVVAVQRGHTGGVFVAGRPDRVQFGATVVYFNPGGLPASDLLEARLHIEKTLAPVAFDRATAEDVAEMRSAVPRLAEIAEDPRRFFIGLCEFHRTVVSAAHVNVLDAMHQSIVALLTSRVSRAVFIPGHEEVLHHSIDVHSALVDAIDDKNREAFQKLLILHGDDLVSTGEGS